MFWISNEWFKNDQIDLQSPSLLEELASAVPMVAETVETLSRGVWNMSYNFPLQEAPRELNYTGLVHGTTCDPDPDDVRETSAPSPTRTLARPVEQVARHRYELTCVQCRRNYDRFSRARDCQYQDLGLTPYLCRGGCGDTKWFASPLQCFCRHTLTDIIDL
jgi:hypothetical protein